MTVFLTTFILFVGSLLAGFLGSLSGLGGGLIIVPLIVLGIGADIHYAIGSSLIAVIVTSTASSCAYVKEGYSNVRIGIFLETATTVGALFGVVLASLLSAKMLSLTFGAYLIYATISTLRQSSQDPQTAAPTKLATFLKLNGEYPVKGGFQSYSARYIPWGYLVMFVAGAFSGALGLGSGILKVIALDKIMGLPFKVSTTTSNFMIGVTAAASAGLYLSKGYIDPVLTMPIVIGITLGSLAGARILPHANVNALRKLFAVLVMLIAAQMIVSAIVG